MALKPTIYKIELQLSDTDRHCYETCQLTLAQHPSETLQRMMVRLLVYAMNYHQDVCFTRGLSSTDEPELWQIAPDGTIEHWIELGQASPERLRKAVSRAPKISLYAYGREVDVWWHKQRAALTALPKVSVWRFHDSDVAQLDRFISRSMQLSLTISEGELFLSDNSHHLSLAVERLE
ncbi:YaeQ family protein [Amphritea sp. 1_MG-2023]|uniref:YaeQ family protein n=1 Tax=Amphritea sp. 1_MG-2023 TaxID=3062670 RepID=UPI0026E37F1D|nr:YaeQ family protein [Amphritea sp. 1_MG-2023]MDO6565117.1 YaeQ family protein [Amphritea sp. 1_MG-2023]